MKVGITNHLFVSNKLISTCCRF